MKGEVVTFWCNYGSHMVQFTQVDDWGGTGFAYMSGGTTEKICYECCGKQDAYLMHLNGRATLYLTKEEVTNWPGTLRFHCRIRIGRHNWGLKRRDVWFNGPDGMVWHGVQIGEDSQLTRCKRTKAKAS